MAKIRRNCPKKWVSNLQEEGEKLMSNFLFADESQIKLLGNTVHKIWDIGRKIGRTSHPFKNRNTTSKSWSLIDFVPVGSQSFILRYRAKKWMHPTYYKRKPLLVYFKAMDCSIFLRKNNIIFQKDGAASRSTKPTITLLEGQVGIVRQKGVWSGNSSHLN